MVPLVTVFWYRTSCTYNNLFWYRTFYHCTSCTVLFVIVPLVTVPLVPYLGTVPLVPYLITVVVPYLLLLYFT
ncbi:putative integral membrane protein [Brugia pahangi]